jgi:hypothetical protein
MNETANVFDPPQPKLRIKSCSMAAGADMGAVAATIEKIEEEGFDLVTAYGVPVEGGRVAHFFVLRRKPETQSEQAITITDASGRSISISAASIEVGKIDTPAPASKPAGKDKRR